MSSCLPLFLVALHSVLQNGADGLGKAVQSLACHAVTENANGMGVGIELDEFLALFGISQRGLVEKQNGRLITRHLTKLGITGAHRDAGVQNFYDDVYVFEVLGDQTASLRHVTREPLNMFAGHLSTSFALCRCISFTRKLSRASGGRPPCPKYGAHPRSLPRGFGCRRNYCGCHP